MAEAWRWQMHAQCRFFGSELFFAPDGERHGARVRRERQAKQVCMTCSVRIECRGFAFDGAEMHGVWGAMSELELRRSLGQHSPGPTESSV
ncbi:WhiB family transcriptional regulator [Rhodococcus sp. NPDC059234]|uniref:WhiB family transcriptional regulator n=1 Tax=Rhodococcus sp. NPDC059234 TaxID=3346781 RepID=UPI00366B3468